MSAVQLVPVAHLPEGGRLEKEVEGRKLLVVHRTGQFHVVDALCFHMGGPLGSGDIEDGPTGDSCVKCPWHGRLISLTTGAWVETRLDGHVCESHGKQRVYRTAVKDGWLWVELPNANAEGISYESDKHAAAAAAAGGGLNGQGMGLFGSRTGPHPHGLQQQGSTGAGGLNGSGFGLQQGAVQGAGSFSAGLFPQQGDITNFSRAFKPSARRAQARAALLKNYKPPPMAVATTPSRAGPTLYALAGEAAAAPPSTPLPSSASAGVSSSRAAGGAAGGTPIQRTLDSYFRPVAASPMPGAMAGGNAVTLMDE